MPVIKLTQDAINKGLPCPEGQTRIEYCDKELPGLIIILSGASLNSTYFLRYKNAASKTSYIKIGRTNSVTLADARKKAKLLKLEVSNGADPANDKRVMKAVPTFSEFYEEYYKPYAYAHKRSASSDHQLYKCRLESRYGNLRLNQITKTMLISFHNELKESGLAGATCDHYLKFLRQAFNRAIAWELVKDNPAAGVKLFNLDNKMENYLDAEQLERLFNVLKTDPNRPVCLIIMMAICTGARLNEILCATWSQINRETRTWKIPALNNKGKKVRSVPLNNSSLDIINQLDTEGEFEYLFINRVTGKPYRSIHKYWGKLRERANMRKIRIHDMRHTHASLMVNSGRTILEVSRILGHSSVKVTERYTHLSTSTLQDASNSASIIISKAMGNKAA